MFWYVIYKNLLVKEMPGLPTGLTEIVHLNPPHPPFLFNLWPISLSPFVVSSKLTFPGSSFLTILSYYADLKVLGRKILKIGNLLTQTQITSFPDSRGQSLCFVHL